MDDDLKDKVVDLYKSGTKTAEITEQTGVPRPTIYWILNERGIRPSRTKRAPQGVDQDQLLERLAAAEREVGRLTELLQRERILNEALMERAVGASGPALTEP